MVINSSLLKYKFEFYIFKHVEIDVLTRIMYYESFFTLSCGMDGRWLPFSIIMGHPSKLREPTSQGHNPTLICESTFLFLSEGVERGKGVWGHRWRLRGGRPNWFLTLPSPTRLTNVTRRGLRGRSEKVCTRLLFIYDGFGLLCGSVILPTQDADISGIHSADFA